MQRTDLRWDFWQLRAQKSSTHRTRQETCAKRPMQAMTTSLTIVEGLHPQQLQKFPKSDLRAVLSTLDLLPKAFKFQN